MSTRVCLKCDTRGGLNFLQKEVLNNYDPKTGADEMVKWTCPYCGFSEEETIYREAQGGTYNSGIVQGPLIEDDEPVA